jgi:hypothetical protein
MASGPGKWSLVASLWVLTMLAPAPSAAIAQTHGAKPEAGTRLTTAQVSRTPAARQQRPSPPQEDNSAPGVLFLLTAGLAVVSALVTALAWIGWRARRTGAWPPEARRRRPPGADPATDTAAPPDPALEWAAEIEWHRDPGGGSRFCIVASTGGTRERTAVSESEPLGWPPNGPESVDALTHAVEQLEAGAVAAGWRPAPAGRAWYAKRFTWQPARTPTHR